MSASRICVATTTYPRGERDATPRFVADLCERLVRDHGFELRVVAPHEAGLAERETLGGVEVVRFRYTRDPRRQRVAYGAGIPDNLRASWRARSQLPAFALAMTRAVRRESRDARLVHAHWIETGALAALATAGRGLPLVLSVHSVPPRAGRIARFALRAADAVLFNSRASRDRAAALGLPAAGRVVYPGFDETRFAPGPRDGRWRERLGIAPTDRLVVAVGRLIELKGFERLVEAAAILRADRRDVRIAIAGDGPRRDPLLRAAAAAGIADRVQLTGALEREALAALLREADLFAAPGVEDAAGRCEAFGLAAVEAAACGLACVGSRIGGIPETIVDGETGQLVPPGDAAALAAAVGGLLDDPVRRRTFGEAGARRARSRFSWSVVAAETARVYRELIDGAESAA